MTQDEYILTLADFMVERDGRFYLPRIVDWVEQYKPAWGNGAWVLLAMLSDLEARYPKTGNQNGHHYRPWLSTGDFTLCGNSCCSWRTTAELPTPEQLEDYAIPER